jgi:O-antigen ligase
MMELISVTSPAGVDGLPLPARAESALVQPGSSEPVGDFLCPNTLVRWAFYLSVFSIPFSHLYLPGTGGRVGFLRLVQIIIVGGVLSQPRVCLRLIPTALFWFLAYCAVRIIWGLWLTPEKAEVWWPNSRESLEFLPWLWVMFNVLQFPDARRGGLWALGLGCSLCALFHIAGVGVAEVANDPTGRSSVFGLNANELGVTYATAVIALLGLWMLQSGALIQRLIPFPLIATIGLAMAKTGSRSAVLILAMGVLVLLFLGKSGGSRTRRFASLLMIGALLAVILWEVPTVMERFKEINPQNIGQDNPRARMAPVLWEMFLRSPIYGLGPDDYEFELTRRAMPYLIQMQKLIAAHNLALLLLVETGIIGLLLFSFGLKAALLAAWKARFRPCGSLPLALLLPLIIGGITVCNPSHYLVFWVAVAYALAGVA